MQLSYLPEDGVPQAAKDGKMSPPDLDFRGQPIKPDDAAGSLLKGILADVAYDEVVFVVAWARFRGLWRLREELDALKARGNSRIILGIDEGGATRPGLLVAIELFTQAYVFHDERPGTFHPKLYLARGAAQARLIVGSSNVTPGGLFTNVEASLDATFDLPAEAGHSALVNAERFIEALLEQPQACSELTAELVDDLVANKRYRVSSVERRRTGGGATVPTGVDPTDVDEDAEEVPSNERLFGSATFPAGAVPAIDEQGKARQVELEVEDELDVVAPEPPDGGTPGAGMPGTATPPGTGTPGTGTPGAGGGGAGGGPPIVRATWNKTLRRADAQQPEDPTKTNPTGVLRLSKAGNPIDWRTFFRRDLFQPANWVNSQDGQGNPIETASVPFNVVIAGASHGVISLRVDHAPHREAGQNNVPTILHWGDTLGPLLRSTPLQGEVITLSRLSNGDYELTIA